VREFEQLRRYMSELKIARDEMRAHMARYKESIPRALKNKAYARWVVSTGLYEDSELNKSTRTFVVIARETMAACLTLMHLLRPALEAPNPQHQMPNPGRNNAFSPFVAGVAEDRYEYDEEVLGLIREHLDVLIFLRLWRNWLKETGVTPMVCCTEQGNWFEVKLRPNQMKDKSLQYYSDLVESPVIEVLPGFFDEAWEVLDAWAQMLHRKWRQASGFGSADPSPKDSTTSGEET